MRGRLRATQTWIVGGGIILAAVVLGALLVRRAGAAGASALSASPDGWLAARTYLERRGAGTSLLARPLSDARVASASTLVLTFPWQSVPTSDDLDALRRHLAAGGAVVFAYSGRTSSFAEDSVADDLGLEWVEVRGDPPLSPLAWYDFVTAESRLQPEPELAGAAAEVVIQAPDRVPKVSRIEQVFSRGADGSPMAFTFRRGPGRVVVLPADALANARLSNSGNADLLESLRDALPGELVFDEYHHGLLEVDAAADSGAAPSLDLLLIQLALLYAAVVWALGRRPGPAWREPLEITSSTGTFLLGLGALHRRLGHAAPACRRLLEVAERYDPRVAASAGLRRAAFDAGDDTFVQVARTVARQQRRGRSD